jgi:triosephosphate isomerase
MRNGMVVGNWKMHGSRAANEALVGALIDARLGSEFVRLAVCPPFPYLAQVAMLLRGSSIAVGAQNVAEHDEGAYTGEVCADMLADVGCRYVIVGHSERRQLYGEASEVVARKVGRVIKAGMSPIVCVGETLEQREAGNTLNVVAGQLTSVIAEVGADRFAVASLAYEPVWAIGTGRTASPCQAQEVHASLRRVLVEQGIAGAEQICILYGGSVKAANAAELFAMDDVNGALVGGASLDATEFVSIARAMG